jgi:hypothetical protein
LQEDSILKTSNTLAFSKSSTDSSEIQCEEVHAAKAFDHISETEEMMVGSSEYDKNRLPSQTILEQVEVAKHTITPGLAPS